MMWYNIIFYSNDIIVNNTFEISSLFNFSINSLSAEYEEATS